MSEMIEREQVNKILRSVYGMDTALLICKIIEMECALRPFAEASARMDGAAEEMGLEPNPDDNYKPRWTNFSHGELRAARMALFSLHDGVPKQTLEFIETAVSSTAGV